jgi:type VI secretion system protein ImpE
MADGVLSYRALLTAEQARARLFATGEGSPQRMTTSPLDPEPFLGALRRLRAGDAAEASRLVALGEESRPARSGAADGTAFADFRDADDIVAGFLEVFGHGLYGWIPLSEIQRLEFAPPKLFRDLLWRETTITLVTGAASTLFVPVRYALSERHADDPLRLGRATDWRDEGGVITGIGQRTFLVGEEARSVLELQEVVFDA